MSADELNQSGEEFEANDEDGAIYKFRKCTNCNRPTKDHPGNTGRNCEHEPLEGNEMEEYMRNWKKIQKERQKAKSGSATAPPGTAPTIVQPQPQTSGGQGGQAQDMISALNSMMEMWGRQSVTMASSAAAAAAQAVAQATAQQQPNRVAPQAYQGYQQPTTVPKFSRDD